MPFSLSSSALNDYQRYLSLLVGNDAFIPTPPLTVDYLVIAGGGGGGSGDTAFNGGGGAGGYRSFTAQTLVAETSYTVTVGAGGSGSTNGNNSTFASDSSTGGGRGGKTSLAAASGGSGGGGKESNDPATGNAGSYTPPEGYDGAPNASSGDHAGGGGGASQAGSTHFGGDGASSSITGSAVTRGGGGGGGRRDSIYGSNNNGGAGGGGSGAAWQNVSSATSGTANTGGGGGGGVATMAAGSGGSGLVVAKYPATYTMTVGAGLGYKTSISGDYKITEFTAGTGTVSFALETADLGPSEDILQEIVLESSASSVVFENLSQYASDYQHLQIRATNKVARTGSSAGTFSLLINGATTDYRNHRLLGDGSSVSSSNYSSPYLFFGLTARADNANVFAAQVVDILDAFDTSKHTTIRTLTGVVDSGEQNIALVSGLYNTTTAVDSLEFFEGATNSNILAGSRFTLIGVK